MRKLMILVTVLAMAAMIGACADDESTTGPSDLDKNQVKASVDGSDWVSNQAMFSGSTIVGSKVSTDGSSSSISISVGSEPEEGSGTGSCTYSKGTIQDQSNWISTEGSYEITSLTDDEIQGTFEFTGSDGDSEKSVSGSFRVDR